MGLVGMATPRRPPLGFSVIGCSTGASEGAGGCERSKSRWQKHGGRCDFVLRAGRRQAACVTHRHSLPHPSAPHRAVRPRRPPPVTVIFREPAAYYWRHTGAPAVLFDVESASPEMFVDSHGTELDGQRRHSWPVSGWTDLPELPACLEDLGLTPFIVSSTCGMEGWLLANAIDVA